MPREPRELTDGGIYHVYNRGNNKIDLFHEEDDYSFFLNKLLEVKNDIDLKIYHYCLMKNHFHILLQIHKGEDLPKCMHRTQLSYALYHKDKYTFVGHVFQERFRSPRISEESYYLQCGRYIEQNPVKAGYVKNASQYNWSSASYYTHGKDNPLITPNMYYHDLDRSAAERQKKYREYLFLKDPYSSLINQALKKA